MNRGRGSSKALHGGGCSRLLLLSLLHLLLEVLTPLLLATLDEREVAVNAVRETVRRALCLVWLQLVVARVLRRLLFNPEFLNRKGGVSPKQFRRGASSSGVCSHGALGPSALSPGSEKAACSQHFAFTTLKKSSISMVLAKFSSCDMAFKSEKK
eukprot:GGOE01019136.1.p2 GENE.GGOE01019136.1~~GGOE01019136.1.p2  ORF type:complete len:155 (-),score=12.60 GGOE01019136.1:3-467(-)